MQRGEKGGGGDGEERIDFEWTKFQESLTIIHIILEKRYVQ